MCSKSCFDQNFEHKPIATLAEWLLPSPLEKRHLTIKMAEDMVTQDKEIDNKILCYFIWWLQIQTGRMKKKNYHWIL